MRWASILLLLTSCTRMGFDDTLTLPPVQVEPGERKVSVLHVAATRLAGTCTELGGTVSVYGDAESSSPCAGEGAWDVRLDFTNAPDGEVTVSVVQEDADGHHTSPPVEVGFQKDTEVCIDPARNAAAPFADGDGTVDNPYRLCNRTQLEQVGSHLAAHIRLENDIDLSDAPWSWFGTFDGTFDGNGFAIENMTYDSTSNPTGLFAQVNGTVENLGVLNANTYSYCHVGAITGVLQAGGVIRNSFATGAVTSYSDAVGGLVGQNAGTIENCFADVAVTATDEFCVGGLVGVTDLGGTVRGSFSLGQVAAFGVDRVGGLIGCNDGALENSYARGNVVSAGSTTLGGLVGESSHTIRNSYSTGAVNGNDVGGLVCSNTGTITASYWDVDASAVESSDGGTPLETGAMADAASYEGWDFESVWRFDEGSPYPVLRWQQ